MNFGQAMRFCGYRSYEGFQKFVDAHKVPYSVEGRIKFFRRSELLKTFERLEQETAQRRAAKKKEERLAQC